MARKKAVAEKKAETGSAVGTNHSPSDQEIAARAYEIFQGRGGTDGRALDDWLTAEQELRENNKPKRSTRASLAN